MMLFKLQTKEGETRQVAFNATSGLGEYKLVGSDVSDFMAKHENLVHEFESDPHINYTTPRLFNKVLGEKRVATIDDLSEIMGSEEAQKLNKMAEDSLNEHEILKNYNLLARRSLQNKYINNQLCN